MGFFDFLSKGDTGFGREELSFSELEGWLVSRQDDEGRRIVEEAEPVVRDVKKLVEDIRVSVKHFDSLEMPRDMYERAEKIMRTSKPDYVKAMLEELGKLDFSGARTFNGIQEFSVKLEAAVNALGKIDATRGRYLFFGFEGQHKEIQRKGKKLMEVQKRLKDFLESNDKLKGIGSVLGEYGRLKELQTSKEDMIRELGELKARLDDAGRELDEMRSRRKSEASKREYSRLDVLNRGLVELRAQEDKIEDAVFRSVGSIKKDLVKYRRQLFDAPGENRGRILDELTAKPVEAFLAEDTRAIADILEGFRKAVEGGAVSVKDKDKVVSKTENALRELNEGLRREYERITAERKKLESEADGISRMDGRHKLDSEVRGLEEKIKVLKERVGEAEARLKEIDGQILAEKRLLTRMLDELTDGSVKVK